MAISSATRTCEDQIFDHNHAYRSIEDRDRLVVTERHDKYGLEGQLRRRRGGGGGGGGGTRYLLG